MFHLSANPLRPLEYLADTSTGRALLFLSKESQHQLLSPTIIAVEDRYRSQRLVPVLLASFHVISLIALLSKVATRFP